MVTVRRPVRPRGFACDQGTGAADEILFVRIHVLMIALPLLSPLLQSLPNPMSSLLESKPALHPLAPTLSNSKY